MKIQIQFIAVNVEDKGKYKQAEVTYKDIAKGQTTAKKLMSFNNPTVYKTMVDAKNGEQYSIEMQKNDKGYWDWIDAKIANGQDDSGSSSVSPKPANVAPRSTYETPEERAQRQVYIIRQSSLSNAIETLKTDKKNPSKEEVVELAKYYEDYVFDRSVNSNLPLTDLPTDDLGDDIPY